MKSKKKKGTPKERLLKALSGHFGKMPEDEANAKINKLHRQVTADRANDRAKRQRQVCDVLIPRLARHH